MPDRIGKYHRMTTLPDVLLIMLDLGIKIRMDCPSIGKERILPLVLRLSFFSCTEMSIPMYALGESGQILRQAKTDDILLISLTLILPSIMSTIWNMCGNSELTGSQKLLNLDINATVKPFCISRQYFYTAASKDVFIVWEW